MKTHERIVPGEVAPVVTAIGVFLTMAVFHQVRHAIPISRRISR